MTTIKQLKSYGIRVTPQRRAVYQAVSALRHCSVEQVVQHVTAANPSITAATIYNTLDSFTNCGLISRMSTEKGKLYYDINIGSHAHIVDKSGQINDYTDQGLIDTINNYLSLHPIEGVEIEKISLNIFKK